MSHVFISYKREDMAYRDKLIGYLSSRNIPLWADLDIEAGLGWREEIDAALSDAFALLVVVTNNTPTSHYVTYEWAWALGNRIPVIPLLFEETQIGNLHRKLSSLQFTDCCVEIPANLGDILIQHQKQSQLARYANTKIANVISPSMLVLSLTLIFSEYYGSDKVTELELGSMLHVFNKYLEKLNTKMLPDLWLAFAHSFTPLQQKMLQEFASEIEILAPIVSAEYSTNVIVRDYKHHEFLRLSRGFSEYPKCLPKVKDLWNRRLKTLWYFFIDNSHYGYYGTSSGIELIQKTDLLSADATYVDTEINMLFYQIMGGVIEKHEVELFKRIKIEITGLEVGFG